MRKIVIRVDPENRQWWKETMSDLLPGFEVFLWDEDQFEPDAIDYVITWAPPPGMIASLPNLKCVFSVGAGVSHITDDPTFPRAVPIVRTVGDALRQRMCEYVALHVLRIHRRLPELEESSRKGEWNWIVTPTANQFTVGLMGVGNLGAAVANTLCTIGYRVRGLSRRGRAVEGVEMFAAEDLDGFLQGVQVLVSILPGTAQTENIINAEVMIKLPQGAWIVNVGRGSHVKDDDLLAALDSGHLGGAVLDVFRDEPLAAGSPYWSHPNVLVTSHTAAPIEPAVGGAIIARNLLAFDRGEEVRDLVDIEQGY